MGRITQGSGNLDPPSRDTPSYNNVAGENGADTWLAQQRLIGTLRIVAFCVGACEVENPEAKVRIDIPVTLQAIGIRTFVPRAAICRKPSQVEKSRIRDVEYSTKVGAVKLNTSVSC